MISPAQCRAARALLNWSQQQLADRSGLSFSTIRDFEKGRHVPYATNLATIEQTLTEAGVRFLDGNCVCLPGANDCGIVPPKKSD
jgi:transcriptional regulator with XRE-family HTH domain